MGVFEKRYSPKWIYENFTSFDRIVCEPFIKTNMIELADNNYSIYVYHKIPLYDNFGKSRPKIRLEGTKGTLRITTRACHLLNDRKVIDLFREEMVWVGANAKPHFHVSNQYEDDFDVRQYAIDNEHQVMQWINDARYNRIKQMIDPVDNTPLTADNVIDLLEYIKNNKPEAVDIDIDALFAEAVGE